MNPILPNFMTSVSDNLIRGRAVSCPYRLYRMKQDNITQIIDLRNSAGISQVIERFFCKIFGINYVNCKYSHRMNKLPETSFFENINSLINRNNGKTYLHCQYGKRRTGIAAAFYEKENTNKTEQEILENLINLGFKDIFQPNAPERLNRYKNILDEFLKRYFQ